MESYDLINVFKKSLWLLGGEPTRGPGQRQGDHGEPIAERMVVALARVGQRRTDFGYILMAELAGFLMGQIGRMRQI